MFCSLYIQNVTRKYNVQMYKWVSEGQGQNALFDVYKVNISWGTIFLLWPEFLQKLEKTCLVDLTFN